MNESVNLCKTTIKKPNGTKYVYWVLRWRDTSGKHHGKNIGRTNKMSKRQAEKLRQAKALELFSQPGRRNVSGSPALGEYLDGYYEARKSELAPGTMKLHKPDAISRGSSVRLAIWTVYSGLRRERSRPHWPTGSLSRSTGKRRRGRS